MRNCGELLFIWTVAFGLVGGAPLGAAQGDNASQSGLRIATALRFLQAVHGDQPDTTNRIQIEGRLWPEMDVREFGIQLGTENLVGLRSAADLTRSQCYARFVFSDLAMWQYSGHGQCVKEAENSAFVSAVGAHPQWTDGQIATELARRGGRFGPDARRQITERIPATGLISDVVGELVEPGKVTFEMPDRIDGKILASDAPCWRVVFAVIGKPRTTVVVTLEPFEGRLNLLLRLPPE